MLFIECPLIVSELVRHEVHKLNTSLFLKSSVHCKASIRNFSLVLLCAHTEHQCSCCPVTTNNVVWGTS